MNDLLSFLASSGIGFHEPRYMGHRPKPARKGPAKFSMHGRKMRYHLDPSPSTTNWAHRTGGAFVR